MAYLTLSEHIARTPDEVFAYLMDFEQAPRWRRLVERIELVGSGYPGVGSSVRVTYRVNGETQERNFTIAEYQPPRLMAWKREVASHEWVVRYRVDPDGAGSRVTLTLDASARAWLDRVKLWLFRRTQEREMSTQLRSLKQVLQASSS